jgi:16S rRNA C967 or C1407 C5-methylase (RsmB/RsmF family)
MKRSFPKKPSSSPPSSLPRPLVPGAPRPVSAKAPKRRRFGPPPLDQSQLRVREFERIWKELFTTPAHLDSAISRAPRELKPWLATVLPVLLRRPITLLRDLGIPVPQGAPWSLGTSKLLDFRPVHLAISDLAQLEGEELSAALGETGSAGDFPDWFLEEAGAGAAERLAPILSSDPPVSLRLNSLKMDRTVFLQKLPELLGETSPAISPSSVPFGVRLDRYAPVLNTSLFKEGCFEIQDEGSQLMSLFALWPETFQAALAQSPGPPPADSPTPTIPVQPNLNRIVIDACAGAGGKTLAMADALKGKGRVYAYDTSAKKLQALKLRARRSGLNNIQTLTVEENNERAAFEKFLGTADVVLVDAPCSGWGVLRRNPDIKWRQKSVERDRMAALQLRILDTYLPLVKRGGVLVYGVCTFREEETEKTVSTFLASHPNLTHLAKGFFGPGASDGFYMAALRVS